MKRFKIKYSIKNKVKHITSLVFMSLFSLLYFWLAYIGLKSQDINLKDINSYNGKIVSIGETYRNSIKYRPKVFYVQLSGLNQTLGVYRMSKDYQSLLTTLNVGDFVTVYYKSQKSTTNVNIDLVQLEKNGLIVLDKKEYEDKEFSLVWIGIIAGIASVSYTIWFFLKKAKPLFSQTKTLPPTAALGNRE